MAATNHACMCVFEAADGRRVRRVPNAYSPYFQHAPEAYAEPRFYRFLIEAVGEFFVSLNPDPAPAYKEYLSRTNKYISPKHTVVERISPPVTPEPFRVNTDISVEYFKEAFKASSASASTHFYRMKETGETWHTETPDIYMSFVIHHVRKTRGPVADLRYECD